MPPIPIIELTNVAKSFDDGRTHALHGISLRIEAGGFIALVGTSGSGKTTAMKMINRLLDPDRGQVRFEGAAVESLDAPTLRRGIGYVFQGIGLFPHMTIGENWNCSILWNCRAAMRRDFLMRYPAASASAPVSRGRSRRDHASC